MFTLNKTAYTYILRGDMIEIYTILTKIEIYMIVTGRIILLLHKQKLQWGRIKKLEGTTQKIQEICHLNIRKKYLYTNALMNGTVSCRLWLTLRHSSHLRIKLYIFLKSPYKHWIHYTTSFTNCVKLRCVCIVRKKLKQSWYKKQECLNKPEKDLQEPISNNRFSWYM